MSNFAIYLIGTVILAGGLGLAAHLLGATPIWITVGVIVILGMGIMGGVRKTRQKEKSDS
jgi:predicted signal transduction protein with EAL and GGDEF domain